MKISEIVNFLESKAPILGAESWDNVGLILGDLDSNTDGAIVCHDLTLQALQMARDRKFRAVITHHPCLFPKKDAIHKITPKTISGPVLQAIKGGISVIACHTNFDRCALEVSDHISKNLGVNPLGRFVSGIDNLLMKLVVFVPQSHLESVKKAICEAGAGQLGNYDYCTFESHGIGTFRGNKGATPFLGQVGKIENAQELRLETVFPKFFKNQILKAMRSVHPYEEIAFDLYELSSVSISKNYLRGFGYGFWGEFIEPMPFSEMIKNVRRLFNLASYITYEVTSKSAESLINNNVELPAKLLKRIGFIAGSGSSFIAEAKELSCDLLITGEVGYHSAREGAQQGMRILELGHIESERFFLPTMAGWLKEIGLKTNELVTPVQRIIAGDMSESTSSNQ